MFSLLSLALPGREQRTHMRSLRAVCQEGLRLLQVAGLEKLGRHWLLQECSACTLGDSCTVPDTGHCAALALRRWSSPGLNVPVSPVLCVLCVLRLRGVVQPAPLGLQDIPIFLPETCAIQTLSLALEPPALGTSISGIVQNLPLVSRL